VVIYGQIVDVMHEDNGSTDEVIIIIITTEREHTRIICVEDVKNEGRSVIIRGKLNVKVFCLVPKRIVSLLNNIGLDEIFSRVPDLNVWIRST
jgi:hypothetical protein